MKFKKLKIGKYYDDYMIDYYKENSFAIGVVRLGHSSGEWYEVIIMKNDNNKYLTKVKFDIFF